MPTAFSLHPASVEGIQEKLSPSTPALNSVQDHAKLQSMLRKGFGTQKPGWGNQGRIETHHPNPSPRSGLWFGFQTIIKYEEGCTEYPLQEESKSPKILSEIISRSALFSMGVLWLRSSPGQADKKLWVRSKESYHPNEGNGNEIIFLPTSCLPLFNFPFLTSPPSPLKVFLNEIGRIPSPFYSSVWWGTSKHLPE